MNIHPENKAASHQQKDVSSVLWSQLVRNGGKRHEYYTSFFLLLFFFYCESLFTAF